MNKNYLFILFTLLFTGCSHNVAQLSLASTKITEINGEPIYKGKFEGEDRHYIIIVFPTGSPRIDNAIDNTLKKHNLDYLTEINIREESFYFPYIGGYTSFIASGQGWIILDSIKVDKLETIKYDPNTGLPIKPKRYDPNTGKIIYE